MAVVARAGGDGGGSNNEVQWCFLQVKGAIDEDVAEADIISTVEFNYTGDLLATGDKGGRVVIFQREQETKSRPLSRGEYNVYSTFQSHEPEFDYLKSLEIEEKINKIRWLPQQNAAHFLLSTNADIISTVEFNYTGDLLATGDKVSLHLFMPRYFNGEFSQKTPS